MINTCICMCIYYPTLYACILPIVDLSVACEPYFVDIFVLSESNPLWVSSVFHHCIFLSGYGDVVRIVLPKLVAHFP